MYVRINPNNPNEEAKKLVTGEFIYGIGFDYGDKKMFWTDRLSHSTFSGDIDDNGDIKNIKFVLLSIKIIQDIANMLKLI